MSDFMKMDIFFVITSIGVVLAVICGIVLCYLLWRIIRIAEVIVKDVSHIVADAKQVAANLKDDVRTARSTFMGTISSLMSLIGLVRKGSRKSASKRKNGEHDTEA